MGLGKRLLEIWTFSPWVSRRTYPQKLRQSAQHQYPRKRDNQHKAEACWNITNLESKTQSTLLPGNFAAAGTRLSSFPGLQRPQQGKTDRA